MPINTILITDTIDTGRQIFNQIVSNLNSILYTGLNANSLFTVNPRDQTSVSLNVKSGIIVGNGVNIFSVNSSSITLGTITNSPLENKGITIVANTGMNGGGFLALGSALTLNIVPNNSFTNSWTNVAVSAQAVSLANTIVFNAAQDANRVNVGTLVVQYGGTGQTSYPGTNGAALIGDGAGGLTMNTIRPGIGISAWYGNGSLSFTANVIAGQNVEILNGNRIQIIAPPIASETVNGIVQLNDTLISTSKTLAATANSVNAVYKRTTTKFTGGNTIGRLLDLQAYTSPGTYTWTKPANTGFVEIILIGAGGGGAGANAGNIFPTNTYTYGMGGYAGAFLYARIANVNVHSTMTVQVGYAGNSSGLVVNGRVGYKGGDTYFANAEAPLSGGHVYWANGGNGGLTVTCSANSINSPNIHVWNSIRKPMYGFLYDDQHPTLAKATGPASNRPQPDYILRIDGEPPGAFLRLSRGNVVGSFGGSVPGWCAGGWVSYCVNTAISGGANCITYGPDGGTVAEQPNGSGFGGGGGGGAYNESGGAAGPVSGASGANGLVIIKVYSRI